MPDSAWWKDVSKTRLQSVKTNPNLVATMRQLYLEGGHSSLEMFLSGFITPY